MPTSTPERNSGHQPLMTLLAINGIAGALLGLAFVAGVLLLDIAHIRSMLMRSGEWLVPVALLSMGSVVTFASVAMGGAIMMMPKDDDKGRSPGSGLKAELVPVRLFAKSARRRHPRHSAD